MPHRSGSRFDCDRVALDSILMRGFFYILLWCLSATGTEIKAETTSIAGFQFKADQYQRDLQNNTVRGRGNAWFKKGTREIWADQIEVDFTQKRATAQGTVHLQDEGLHVWCKFASFNIEGEDAVFEEVVLVTSQLVVTGNVIKRLDAKRYEVEEGSYTNCNIDLLNRQEVSQCTFDWKFYGKHFSMTIEEYAHINDVLVYVREIPIFYFPYLIAPVKTKRQTGFLMPNFTYSENLGNGIRTPFFWALGTWHDLTLTPSHYSKTGFHFASHYRHVYSKEIYGEASVFLLQRRFSRDPGNPAPEDGSRNRSLGLVGESAALVKHHVSLGKRSYSKQIFRYVSDPYYTVDYASDVELSTDVPALRSQLTWISPSDSFLTAVKVEHHQSLVASKDSGVDRGPLTLLPAVYFSKVNSPLFSNIFSWEFDTTLINFYRSGPGYDSVPATLNPDALVHSDPDPAFHEGDYIRVGRRLHFEPRLLTNFRLAPGVQLQPLLKPGFFLYHFDNPHGEFSSRQYLDVEIPIQLYLSKPFQSPFPGYERLNHVLQPRFIYARRALQSGDISHPFYYRDPARSLSNPRFDTFDSLIDYEYMRFELINRFRRKTEKGTERFLRVQLSEQYNLKTDSEDPRFSKRLGPIEFLSELQIWRIYSQFEGLYQMELTENGTRSVRENSLSGLIEYRDPGGDRFSLGNRIRINIDDALTEKTTLVSFYKRLPVAFDLEGGLEYSYQRGELLGARIGLIFASKPRSCWNLNFQFGQDDLRRKYVRFLLSIDFGSPNPVGPT